MGFARARKALGAAVLALGPLVVWGPTGVPLQGCTTDCSDATSCEECAECCSGVAGVGCDEVCVGDGCLDRIEFCWAGEQGGCKCDARAEACVTKQGQPPHVVEAGTPVTRFGQLRVEGAALLDQSGNPLQLKGVSTMWLNWEQAYASSKPGLRWLRDNWGLSVIRAAMGVEPAGAFLSNPTAMLDRVRTVVHNGIDLGVYVIIDWHDHYAELHQPQAEEFFSQMASEFGHYPNVFYETYHEPVDVDWSTVVKPYHEAVSTVIRERDPDNIIIMGTPLWSRAVQLAADNPVAGINLMYALHFYSCAHGEEQRAQAQSAHDRGIAIFVTEWGATEADGGTDPNGRLCLDEAQLWHEFMNERKISWAAWTLDDCPDLSCLFRAGAPRDGGWTDEWLNGHGPFVRDRMVE